MGVRKPVDVRAFVMWHNLAMAGLSLWMVVETLRSVSCVPQHLQCMTSGNRL